MRRIASLFAVSSLLLACLSTAEPAHADASAVALLQKYVNNARNKVKGAGTYGLTVTVVTTQPETAFSSYVEGWPHMADRQNMLVFEDGHWSPAPGFSIIRVPTNYHGTGCQYFSDRRYLDPMSYGWPVFPFAPTAVDNLGIKINAENGSVEWTLNSWGGGKSITDLQAYNGILLGRSGSASVMISVKEFFEAILH